MALFTKSKYKKYLLDHEDIINRLFEKHYPGKVMKISQGEDGMLLFTKTWSDGGIYTYDEIEDSIEFVDNYLKRYINFYLFTDKRHAYLLDIIKRVWSVDEAEKLLIETIQKGYIY